MQHLSKTIMAGAHQSGRALGVEDRTGIREGTNITPRTKKERRRSTSWAFAQLRFFLSYKARGAGVPFVLVPPQYTSQTCSHCLHIGTRTGKRFVCDNAGCHLYGLAVDADINGARVIARLGVSFRAPSGPWLRCPLDRRASPSPRALAVGA